MRQTNLSRRATCFTRRPTVYRRFWDGRPALRSDRAGSARLSCSRTRSSSFKVEKVGVQFVSCVTARPCGTIWSSSPWMISSRRRTSGKAYSRPRRTHGCNRAGPLHEATLGRSVPISDYSPGPVRAFYAVLRSLTRLAASADGFGGHAGRLGKLADSQRWLHMSLLAMAARQGYRFHSLEGQRNCEGQTAACHPTGSLRPGRPSTAQRRATAIRVMTISGLKPTLPEHSVLRMKSRLLQHPDFPKMMRLMRH